MSVAIKKLSHWAWFQILADSKRIQIDPVFIKSRNKPPAGLQEKADVILFTHDHNDHCRKDTLPFIRDDHTQIFAPAACDRKIEGPFHVMKAGQTATIQGISLTAVEAYNRPEYHPDKVWHKKGKGIGYLLSVDGKTIYHAGDTDFIPEMSALGTVDVALLPIGGTFTMDIGQAVEAAMAIRPGVIVPMHARDANPLEFKAKVEAASDARVIVLETGELFEF